MRWAVLFRQQEDLPVDIYPMAPVEDRVSATRTIRGSCADYRSRVALAVKSEAGGLEATRRHYGERLVLVAVQEARSAALGGDRGDVVDSLVITSYIVLERVGRSVVNQRVKKL